MMSSIINLTFNSIEQFYLTRIYGNYNCEKFITKTLNSISKQSFKNWKLKIIDDASSDSTLILIKKFLKDRRINLKRLKRNKGAGFCRNLALKNSKAK